MPVGQVFQCIELRADFLHPPLKNFNAGLGRNAEIAFIEIYSTRHFPETSGIFKCPPVLSEPSLSEFKLAAQVCCLLGIPFRVLRHYVWRRQCSRSCAFYSGGVSHNGN